ncbi:MAG: hypothetical protein OXF44_07495 [Anaerolineaceae bacterium]|nr:hypothetical protein [Anaerolineaceae bacterium]
MAGTPAGNYNPAWIDAATVYSLTAEFADRQRAWHFPPVKEKGVDLQLAGSERQETT